MVRVKICGLTTERDVRLCTLAGADAIGFVTEYPVSVPWNIDRSTARELAARTPPFIGTTAVVGGSVDHILEIAEIVHPHFLQLHGDETKAEIERICSAAAIKGIKVIKALRIDIETGRARFDVEDPFEAALLLSRTGISALAVDSKTGARPAGTGVPLDWRLAAKIASSISIPLILAGGLTIENVVEAVAQVHPYGVDVISGVESTPGVKDEKRVFDFVKKVKKVGVEIK